MQVADLIPFARYIAVLTRVKHGLQGLGIFTRRVLICHAGPWVECVVIIKVDTFHIARRLGHYILAVDANAKLLLFTRQ